MGLSCSCHHGAPAVYITGTNASRKLTKEQIHMIDRYLPDFRIYEPSTERELELTANHWNAVFKENHNSDSRYSLNLNTSSSTHSGSRIGALFDVFYAYLEEHSPALKPVFRSSLHVKSKVLVNVSAVMRSLLENDDVAEKMATLTRTHVHLGVQLEHFNPLGNALLHAMAVVSEEAWTLEVADAWRHLFAHCSAKLLVMHDSMSRRKSEESPIAPSHHGNHAIVSRHGSHLTLSGNVNHSTLNRQKSDGCQSTLTHQPKDKQVGQ